MPSADDAALPVEQVQQQQAQEQSVSIQYFLQLHQMVAVEAVVKLTAQMVDLVAVEQVRETLLGELHQVDKDSMVEKQPY